MSVSSRTDLHDAACRYDNGVTGGVVAMVRLAPPPLLALQLTSQSRNPSWLAYFAVAV